MTENQPGYEYAARDCGWHLNDRGNWVADDQSKETGYPDVEYESAEELCKDQGIEPYYMEDEENQKRYIIHDVIGCYVTFRRVVLAPDEDRAMDAFLNDKFAPEDDLKPVIGDIVNYVSGDTYVEGEYDPAKHVENQKEKKDEKDKENNGYTKRAPALCPDCDSIDIHCWKAEPNGLSEQIVDNECQQCGASWKEKFVFQEIIREDQ